MFDIGDEQAVESYRIPWLIWIHLVVLLLLFALLFFFAVFPLDPDDDDATASSPATASTSVKGFLFDEIQQIDKPLTTNHDSTVTVVPTRQHHPQGGQNLPIKCEIRTGSSMRRMEEITEGEASSLNFHPCHYFQLATVAFLKCFGLDSTSDSSSNRKRRKRKEG